MEGDAIDAFLIDKREEAAMMWGICSEGLLSARNPALRIKKI